MKHRLVAIVLCLLVFWSAGNLAFGQAAGTSETAQSTPPAPSAQPLQFISLPYLQSPLPNSMTVMWMTNGPCVGWVEYGEGASLDKKAFNSHYGLVDANEDLCKIPVTGLKPGTTYSYRAVSKAIVSFMPYEVKFGETVASATYQFTTPDTTRDSVSFVAFNDVHSSQGNRDLLFPVAKKEPFDLAFLNGDIMNHIHDRGHIIDHLVNPFAELCGGAVPFVMVRGNHETRDYYARYLMNYIATPQDCFYFSFDSGPVHFVVLDGGEDKPDDSKEYSGLVDFDRYREEETAWLNQEVKSEAFTGAVFRVAFIHMPLFLDGYGEKRCTEKWAQLLNDAKLDLLICGHTHSHQIIEPQPGQHDYPIVVGGGSEPAAGTVIRGTATRDQLDVTILSSNGETLVSRQVKRGNK